MADEQTNPVERKRELAARLDRARTNLRRDLSHVRYRTAVADRSRESLRRNAGAWLTGGLVAGGATAGFPGIVLEAVARLLHPGVLRFEPFGDGRYDRLDQFAPGPHQ